MHQHLKSAIEDDLAIVVEGLLADNPQWLEQTDNKGNTPLILALTHCPDSVPFLVGMGANVNAVNRKGYPPLFYAVECHRASARCVAALIEAGADVNAKNSDDYSVLHWAVADLGPTYVTPEFGEVVALLVEAGADLEALNHYGFTPLMVAIIECDMSGMQALLDAGANPNAIVPDAGVYKNGQTAFNQGQSLLSLTWFLPYSVEMMKMLLKAGADVHLRDHHGRTALEYWEEMGKMTGGDEEYQRRREAVNAECIALLRQ